MVRETRHLWIGNLPENIREERIREHFKRYGRVQSVKLLPGSNGSLCAAVAFMDIKSASKAHNCEHTLDEHALSTEYYEPGPYTSSQQRFPIGITDDHSAFERTSHFYERGASTPSTPLSASGTRGEMDGYLRRSSMYHAPPDTLRGRPRDRPYRNGPPYPAGTERSACSSNRRNWVYDTGTVRYLNSTDDHGSGKSKKVRSGSESRSGSHSSRSRSPTQSTTGSPHSSDSSTLSESPRSTRVTVQSTVAPPVQQTSTLAVYSEDRRPLAICVRNLPTRSSDTSLKDGLFHEYKKHGKVTWVKVVGTANERYALVCFKKPEDVEKAIEVSQDKLFFGCKIDVVPYHGYDVEDNEARPYDTELDEYHPKATRTLFIGNLEKDVTAGDLRQHFDQFGEIIEIDIKKQPGVTSSYAFCQYADIGSVVQAMRTLDGEPLGEARLKLGFGKSMASSCVWIAGVAEQVSDKYLDLQFRKFGPVSHVVVDRDRGQALIFYEQVSAAAAAVKEMRGVPLRGNRIQIDFASRECQQAFYERIDTQGRDGNWSSFETSRSERDMLCSRYESSRFRYEPPRVRSSSYSRSSGGRTPRRHEVYESPRYKSYEELSPNSDHDDFTSNETPDLRHLHKERNHLQHLLDQLDRPLRSVKAADQGLVVTTHNHRRRLSSHQRSSGEGPAPLCKRRKTGSTSEDERKKHHHHSGDESRPGTPLFDEKPDNNQPQEPRRVPRERPEEPLCLPLPQFAAHCFSNMKSCPSSTTLSNSATIQQAPPASPVRPPSPSSTTSSSDLSPQSPTLEERIRSLDEKYEKWTGRTLQPPTKPKHRLLDVDVRELQPSDIVKSVLAKPSVFDDDSKRLENFGEKYEPRDFSSYPRSVGLEVQRFVPGDPRNPSYLSNLSVKVSPVNSPSGMLLSPCPAAKGLQYPFPSHPPVQPTTSVATTTAGSSPPPCSVARPISKSVEFSVQKAESWLGITKNSDSSSTQKDSLISGGFSQRFSSYSKVDVASQRQGTTKPTDPSTLKIDIPAQKSLDPRIEKANAVTTTTSVLSQRVTVKSSDSLENTKNNVNSQKLSATAISSVNNSVSNVSVTKIGNSSSHFSINNSCNNSNIIKNSSNNNNENKNTNNTVSIGKNSNNGLKEVINTSSIIKSGKEEEADVNLNSVGKTDEISEKSLDCSVIYGKSVKSELESSGEKKDDLISSETSVSLSKESGVASKSSTESESSNISSSEKFSVDSKDKAEGILRNCESTKKLESSLLKSNVSLNKTSNVILADLEEKPLKTVGQNLVKSDANGSSSKTGDSTSSKISEISAKILDDNDKDKHLHLKSALVSKNEFGSCYIPELDSGIECSDKLVKPLIKEKEKEKVLCGKEEKNGKDVEKDKFKDKVIEREKEKDRSLIREKQKDSREIPENVDKERKKDREVEFERKKDRESMEVIEREKKKENDLEADRKKDQSDVLDRRKESSDKKLQDIERVRKKEEHKEKKKERDSIEKKKDWLFSEKHKKSSNDERKKENEFEAKKKDKGERASSIGSKRRVSSQDGLENVVEEIKRAKMDHKRRDSKDSKNVANTNFGNSNNTNKINKSEQKYQETKSFMDSKSKATDNLSSQKAVVQDKIQDFKRKDDSDKKKSLEPAEKKKDVRKIQIKLEDVLKNGNDYNTKNNKEGDKISEAVEEKKHCQARKEPKDREKKKMLKQEFGSNESLEDKKMQKKEKRVFVEKKKDEEGSDVKQLKEKNRNDIKKENGHETDSDSDSEPKKHSIFDVVLDEPAYISMYDKVKARSCKNMQKQEEVKKQVKLKEKFNQLKQSRAKREEKKRSTSWDDDSDSDTSQIRRLPRRSFSRLSSEDECNNKREKKISESWDSENKRLKKSYDTSEDEGIKFRSTMHKSDIYSEDSDSELPDNDEKISRKISSKFKSKHIYEPMDDNFKKSVDAAKENFQSTPKPEKIISDSKNKVRLSLDSSTDRFCYESKKFNLAESMSEGEPSYLSSTKGIEKIERKKSKKRDKRQKSVDNESKVLEGDSAFSLKSEVFLSSNKSDKQERRKSVHSGSENHIENSMNKKKNRCLKETFECNALSKLEDNNGEEVFNDFLEDSNDRLSMTKGDSTVSKVNASKWHVAQVYGTDSDSNVDTVEHMPVGKVRKSKEKRKREKKIREPSEELLKAGKALEKILTSPSCRRDSEEKQCNDNLDDLGEEKLKVNKEKKKKRKKSKDEKSSRHHHHHHHHHHGFTEKIDCNVSSTDCRAEITSSVQVAQSSPSLPSLLEMSNPSLDIKQEITSPKPSTPPRNQNLKSSDKIMHGFGYEIDAKIHETAVQSIALLEIAKVKPKSEEKEAVEESEEKKEDSKERTVISQEETEDAVAALLGETFSYSSCFERNSPLETDPEPHDEEEMRQAVQSLKEGKPDTPQSESGLQIDTDVEESDEHFGGMRFESLPRTPDVDLSQPPKTPDIQPFIMETKQSIPFPRKDTTRNSREEMEVPIVGPSSPESMVPYKNVELEMKDKDVDLMPPVLKPASPKLYKDEPPTIEPISTLNSSERIYVENRLLLHPPPLVPVAKSITVTKSSPGLSLVRPKTSPSSNAPPTLVLTSIRTTTPVGTPNCNSQNSRKPFIVSTSSSDITTSRSSIPPILSPVSASLSTPVLLPSACNESSNLSMSPHFTTSSSIVSSQQIQPHLISQKVILHQVPRATPTRLIPAQGGVVKVVDPLNVQSTSNEMPTLTLPESVNASAATVKTLSTPPPPLGPVVCQSLPPTSSAESVNMTQTESSKTASVISVIPRSLPVTVQSQDYSTFTSISSGVNTSVVPNTPTPLVPSAGSTSVISVHSDSLDAKNCVVDNQHLVHQNVISTSKVLPFPPLQKSVEYEKLPVPDKNSAELVQVKFPSSPKESYTIENNNLDLKNSATENLEVAVKEKLDEENSEILKREVIKQFGDSVENNLKEVDSYEEQLTKNDYCLLKNNSSEFGEISESVIRKVNSVSDMKNEKTGLSEDVENCEKSDRLSLKSEVESSEFVTSEEENKQVNATAARKGRRKVNRVGTNNAKKGQNDSESKPDTPSKKRGVKLLNKSSTVSGKKQSKDVYEFHDESDEDGSGEKDRPRLILTIKSPNSAKDQPVAGPKSCPPVCKSPNSASKSPKESGGGPTKSPEVKSPSTEKDLGIINTRKSKRLLEKDGYRNTVDDVIEDVVKNGGNKKATSPRRSLRQVAKTSPTLTNKKVGARASKKLTANSFTEDDIKKEDITVMTEDSNTAFLENSSVLSETKPHLQVKEEQEPEAETSDEESTTLIDPVTGMLMVMRAKEEGKYVPVANVPPIAPPTPPPPPAKTESLPMVTEGLASHWLTQETLKQAVIKVQTYEGNKVNPVFMNRPPTPPTTPQNRIQESATRLPHDIKKKVIAEQFFESESSKPISDMNKIILQPVPKQKICHLDAGKIYSDINRGEYVETNRNIASESGKIIRQISKIQPVPSVSKNLCSKGVAILTNPNKLYQNSKYVKMPPQNQILTGAVASSPPRVVKTTPPAHELHPMTGAVASPPPRAPHLTSQQPVVTGASSSRALVEPLKGPGASPRGMTIPPYEAAMQSPTQNLQSPPPAHQQGEGINMGHLGHSPFVHPQLMYQQYLRAQEMLPSPYQLTASLQGKLEERERERGAGDMGRSPPLELRSQRATDSPTVYMSRQQYTRYYDEPPPAHLHAGRHIHQAPDAPGQPRLQIATPPHASQVPPQADSLLILLQRYPIMWQGLLALKNDQSAVQMHFVFGNPHVARDSLPCNSDGSTPPLRIAQRMRLEQTQLEGVARKMQMDNEHCMLLALPCGRDHMDVLQQSTNLQTGFITYLQQKQAAGIVNIAHPGSQQAAYVVHIFPSCEFANENLARNAPDLLHRMQEIPHLVIVIATV